MDTDTKAKLSEEQLTLVSKTLQEIKDTRDEEMVRFQVDVSNYSKRVRELQKVLTKRDD